MTYPKITVHYSSSEKWHFFRSYNHSACIISMQEKNFSLYIFTSPYNISGFKLSWMEIRSFYAFVMTSKITLCQSWSKCKRNLTGMCLSRISRPSQESRETTLKAIPSRRYMLINSLLIEATIICYRLVVPTFFTLNLKQQTYQISSDLQQDQPPILFQNNNTEYKPLLLFGRLGQRALMPVC